MFLLKRKSNDWWINKIHELVGSSYIFLTPYVNTRTKILYYHVECVHYSYVRHTSFLGSKNTKGVRCPYCSKIIRNLKNTKTNQEWLKQVRSLGRGDYKFLELYKGNHTSIKYLHKVCGHISRITPANFLAGHGCPYCAGKYQDTNTYKDKIESLFGNEYTLISEYQGASNKVKVKHNTCGYVWSVNATNFIQGKSHCPRCQESLGERSISKILDSYHVKYIQQYTFKYCKYKRPLPFDFYLPDYNLCIEYDGSQHYVKNEFFSKHDPFEERQLKDHIKNMYCKEHGINMLRIPYNHFQSLESIILKRLRGIKKEV